MSIEQFRHRMGLEAGEYTVVTMLRKRIIDKAVDEINNKTDIRVEYDLIKTGKSFSHIHFKVRPRQEIIQQEDETLQMLAQRGIKPAQASELFQKHDKQYILSHIAITEERIKRGKVQNPAAYFLKGLQLDYRETETEFTTVQKQKKAAREQEKVKAEESAAREKEQRSSEAIQKESAVASYLSGLSSEEVQKLQNLCYTEVIAPNALFNKAFGQRGFEHVAVQKVFSDFVFGYMNQ